MQQKLAALILLLLFPGCMHQPAGTSDMTIIPDVPAFAAQLRADDCGSVALASLLGHAGRQVSPALIDREIYDPILKGSLLLDMENFAAAQGVTTQSGRGDLASLRSVLEEGTPVLMPLDMGWGVLRRPHYVVVFGYDAENFLFYKQQGPPDVITAAELDRRWLKMGRLYLYLK